MEIHKTQNYAHQRRFDRKIRYRIACLLTLNAAICFTIEKIDFFSQNSLNSEPISQIKKQIPGISNGAS